MLRRSAALLVLIGCAHAPEPGGSSPDATGCYRVASVPSAPSSVRVGTVLCITDDEVEIDNGKSEWARMSVDWAPDGHHREGVLRSQNTTVAFPPHGEGIELVQDGTVLGEAVPLNGSELDLADRRWRSLPTVSQFRERLRACFTAQASAQPDRVVMPDLSRLDAMFNSASFLGLSALARHAFIQGCLAVPETCRVADAEPDPAPPASCAK